MKGREGEVWEVTWSSYPRQLLLVVSEQPDWGTVNTVDLQTGEQMPWLASDLRAGHKVKCRIKRVA